LGFSSAAGPSSCVCGALHSSSATPTPAVTTLRPPAVFCLVLMSGAIFAALLVWWETETLVGAGPLLALASFALAWTATRIRSRPLLYYALLQPVVTGAMAISISVFHWGPREATIPARIVFTASAIAAVAWGAIVIVKLPRSAGPTSPRQRCEPPRFSIRALLGLTTTVCLFLVVGKALHWAGDYWGFAAYGLLMMVSSTIILARSQRPKLRIVASTSASAGLD
jgi:hypothetical protein